MDCSEFEFGDDNDLDELDYGFDMDGDKKRYVNPGRKKIVSKPVKYRNALNLAKQIGDIKPDDRYFCLLDGNFIQGDFIEAWIIHNQWNVTEMTISTLSLSENNVDSLGNLFYGDYLQKLNIIVSEYFFAHERHNLVPYMYKELDQNNAFQLAVARVHTKICLIKTECGKEILIHGSANLRTSKNVEQIMIECDPELYEFNNSWHNEIIERYATIKKTIGARDLWRPDQANTKKSTHIEKRSRKNTAQKKLAAVPARQRQDGKQSRREKPIQIPSHSKPW